MLPESRLTSDAGQRAVRRVAQKSNPASIRLLTFSFARMLLTCFIAVL
jgi:hypothetical protein